MAEVKSVVFKNFTNEEFVCSWDGVPYRFPPGKEMYVEDWKANHFAKHLVDKVLNKTNTITSNKLARDPLLAQALPEGITLTADEAFDLKAREEVKKIEEKTTEETAEVKKRGKPSKKVVEEEFEGLNNK